MTGMQLKLEKRGTLITLADAPMATGGEASLHVVQDNELMVAKVYHKPTTERAEKLHAMIANPPVDPMVERGHHSIAWPQERLLSPLGEQPCVGYVMPRVLNMRPLFDFYNPRTRRAHCPLFNYRYLIRTARNLAAAFSALHARGYVVGDINESNILVSETALATLVDTDSFQVIDGHRLYRCPVGKPEFTPPELQGVTFRDVDRTEVHDRFGLAVLIFMLLMEGTHPFSGRRLDGDGDPGSLATHITAGNYPYSVTRRGALEPMPFAPPLGVLHPAVRNLMRECFETGHTKPQVRPNAVTWQRALELAESKLTACPQNPQHLYRFGMPSCPWCYRTQLLNGRDPFPSREAVKQGEHQPETPRIPTTP